MYRSFVPPGSICPTDVSRSRFSGGVGEISVFLNGLACRCPRSGKKRWSMRWQLSPPESYKRVCPNGLGEERLIPLSKPLRCRVTIFEICASGKDVAIEHRQSGLEQ